MKETFSMLFLFLQLENQNVKTVPIFNGDFTNTSILHVDLLDFCPVLCLFPSPGKGNDISLWEKKKQLIVVFFKRTKKQQPRLKKSNGQVQ